jgi:ATP-dependent Clp protease ATP-binding subunit ClpA
MPKINVYLPDELAAAVRDAGLPVSSICQAALESAVRSVGAARATDLAPDEGTARGRLFRHFTPRARSATSAAQEHAKEHGHSYVGTEHLLLGMLDEAGNLALRVLEALDVEPEDVRAELLASLPPDGPDSLGGRPRFTPLTKKALEHAATEATAFGHNYIGCEHLLLGLVSVEDGLASQVLRRMGVELRTTRRTVTAVLSGFASALGPDRRATPSRAALAEILRRLEAIEARLAG